MILMRMTCTQESVIMSLVELLDDNTMVCSCNRHRRHLMTCGHIMLIVGISHPVVFHVRWWNSFQLHCARDNKLTEHFNKMLMNTNDAVSVKGLIIDLQHGLCLCCFDLFHNCYCNFNYHCNYKFSHNYNFHCNYKFSCNYDFYCNYNFFGAHYFGLFSLHDCFCKHNVLTPFLLIAKLVCFPLLILLCMTLQG